MQRLNFGRKYDEAKIIDDFSHFPNKPSVIELTESIMKRVFPQGIRITVELFALRRTEHGNFGR